MERSEPSTATDAGPGRTPPDPIYGYADACRPAVFHASEPGAAEPAGPWQVAAWDQPDLSFIGPFVTSRYRQWPLYVPQLELVPCGHRSMPALFVRVGRSEFHDWSTSTVPRQWEWRWFRTRDDPYVVLRLAVWFENTEGEPLGLGGVGRATHSTLAGSLDPHRLCCATAFDPADPDHCRTIEAWVRAPEPVMMFFVDEFDAANGYLSLFQRHDLNGLSQLAEAKQELATIPADRRGTFHAAAARLKLPALTRW